MPKVKAKEIDVWSKTRNFIANNNIAIDMVIELTHRCNLNCLHCYNLKDNCQLEIDQVDFILDQLRQAGCLFINYTGGEVFTHSNFWDILKLTRQKGFDITLITNGTLIDDRAVSQLKEIATSDIGISLYSMDAKIHDSITRVRGSFEKSLRAIRTLKREGLNVHIKCSLMKTNIDQYKKLESFAKDLDIPCVFDPTLSPKDDGSCSVLKQMAPQEKIEDFYFSQFSQIDDSQSGEENANCLAGSTFGAISAKGQVYPCIQLPLSVGNIFEENFKEIWTQSKILNKMRESNSNVLKACQECAKLSYCSRCPGLAFLENGDAFGCSATACLVADIYDRFKKINDESKA